MRRNFAPTNVNMNRATLIQNCQGFSSGAEKFSRVISSSVAAPSSPTTAGRSPAKTDCTTDVLIYLMNSRLMRIMRTTDGNISANVASALPTIDME